MINSHAPIYMYMCLLYAYSTYIHVHTMYIYMYIQCFYILGRSVPCINLLSIAIN